MNPFEQSTDAERSREWIPRLALTSAVVGLAWYTWGHWGDLQVDCVWELYIREAIVRGKLLYRDIWYPYGPLTP